MAKSINSGNVAIKEISSTDTDSKDIESNPDKKSKTTKAKRNLISRCLAKFIGKPPPVPEKRTVSFPRPSWYSYLMFSWVGGIVRVGFMRRLENTDLFIMDGDISVEHMSERFLKNYENRTEKYLSKKRKQGLSEEQIKDLDIPKSVLLFSVSDTFGVRYWIGGLLIALTDVGQTLQSLVTKKLISFVEGRLIDPEKYPIGKGIGYSFGLIGMILALAFTMNHSFYNSMLTGAKVRSVLTNVMYQKSMKLSNRSRTIYTNGKISTLVGADLSRLDFAFELFHFNYTFPVAVAVTIALLIVNLGPSALVGVAVVIVALLCIVINASNFIELRVKINKYTDKRVTTVNEVLNSMKMIKFYAWEEAFDQILSSIRTNEMDIILKLQRLRNFINALVNCIPIIAAMLSFVVMSQTGRGLDPANIFSSLTLFNMFRLPLMMLPMSIATTADGLVAFDRISLFLQAEESETEPEHGHENIGDNAIVIENGSFIWETATEEEKKKTESRDFLAELVKKKKAKDEENEKHSKPDDLNEIHVPPSDHSSDEKKHENPEISNFVGLSNIKLSIKKGEFIILTGSIGTGKSSLLYAMAGLMKKTTGNLSTDGKLVFCSYPWIQNTTIRENITFGSEFDEDKYNTVIDVCQLNDDLDMLPAGDMTEIGERGVNLSGGQKARVALTRSVYSNHDIILLDDILSAVDATVGEKIVKECILGYLKDKTRILATHQLSLINSADKVIFLNDKQVHFDKPEVLFEKLPEFKILVESNINRYNEEEKKKLEEEKKNQNDFDILNHTDTTKKDKKEVKNARYKGLANGQLIEQEDRDEGSISNEIYKKFFLLGSGDMGYFALVILVFLSSLSNFVQLFSSIWLSFWTSGRYDLSSGGYIGIYVMFGILSSVFVFCAYYFASYLFNRSSLNLYRKAAKSILYSPMSFFDVTPVGRILNRFTKDTDVADNELTEMLKMVINSSFNVLGTLIMAAVYLPWILICVPIFFIIYYSYFQYYIESSREVKRLESLNRSLVYSNLTETISGIDTVKGFHQEERFQKKNCKLINDMNSAYFITTSNQRWLSLRLDILASFLSFLVAILCVNSVFKISASSTGLLLSNITQIGGLLVMIIRSLTQLQNCFVSVERLYFYGFELKSEAAYHIEDTKPRDSWPEVGTIEFENVFLNYRANLPFVLHDLSFKIKPHEKIGICGRTGAGKSTIMSALYRLTEIGKGKIIIDNIDTSTIGLYELRSRMAVIPQDPSLFLGTVRTNLDPFNEFEDDELWNSIRNLLDQKTFEYVRSQNVEEIDGKIDTKSLHKFHLDQIVEDGGSNFSLGEKQLIALARALIKKVKILILDEATSSVDYETDIKIQDAISNQFSSCTILCIAHRLRTILNYDRIMVLDNGGIQEFDTPLNLFLDKNSVFSQMCEKSGITENSFKKN